MSNSLLFFFTRKGVEGEEEEEDGDRDTGCSQISIFPLFSNAGKEEAGDDYFFTRLLFPDDEDWM